MPFNPNNFDDVLPDGTRKNYSVMFKLIVPVYSALAVVVMLMVCDQDSVNNALDTGNYLVEGGIHEFFASLKLFLHQAYRWIVRACS